MIASRRKHDLFTQPTLETRNTATRASDRCYRLVGSPALERLRVKTISFWEALTSAVKDDRVSFLVSRADSRLDRPVKFSAGRGNHFGKVRQRVRRGQRLKLNGEGS